MGQNGEIWVWVEQRQRVLQRVSLELLGKGAELAQSLGMGLGAVLMGAEVGGLARELLEHGAERVYLAEDPALGLYDSEAYTQVLATLAKERQPEIVLLGATSIGKDLAPRLAARLRTGLTAHCIDISMEGNGSQRQVVYQVPGWGSNVIKIVCPERRPQMATVRPGVLAMPQRDGTRHGEVVRVIPDLGNALLRAQTLEMVEEPTGEGLEAAEVVVAGGWGMNALGGFGPVEELSQVLGGAVAGTRPALDKGWITEEQLIGQSGKTVSPKVFVSLGASGAMHFTTGFLKAKAVLAVDQNPKAPIFEVADIGIVGDLREVLPCLIEELKRGR